MSKNYGFLQPVIDTSKNYIFGGQRSLGGNPLSDGHWMQYDPPLDVQAENGFDTEGCAIYGTLNGMETLMHFLHPDVAADWSQRVIAVLADAQPTGNDVQHICEVIRLNGLVDEALLPFDPDVKNFDQWKSPIPLPADLVQKGQDFVSKWKIGHEWVPNDPASMLAALKLSPLGVAVWAWGDQDQNGYYHFPAGQNPNHWCCIVDYAENEYWLVFDSYEGMKKVAWGENFAFVKRFSITPNVDVSIIDQIIQDFVKMIPFFSFLVKQHIAQNTNPMPVQPPANPVPVTPAIPPVQPLVPYLWDNAVDGRHSVRVICDEEKLSVDQKNVLCACVEVESNFNPKAVHFNKDKDSNILSTDFGIVQVNDYWNIGPGKPFPSSDYVLQNPEACVRWMCKMWLAGRESMWASYTSGAYEKYL